MMIYYGNRIRLMTFTSLFYFGMIRWRLLLIGATLLLAAGLLWHVPRVPGRLFRHVVVAPRSVMHVMDLSLLQEHAAVFRPAVLAGVTDAADIWSQYRFAGTFFLYDDVAAPEASRRRAVISYHPEQRQYIVSEGDLIGGADVIRIGISEVVLRRGDQEGVLQLRGEHASPAGTDGRAVAGKTPDDVAVETRFGRQTGVGTWSMDREALLAYYEELLDEPERLLQVFDSMQPIYTADGSIEGYQLQPVGEEAFFAAVGFEEGDTVRAVNTLAMTNRRRAEFFIRQVVENDLDAIVIDLERDGSPKRLVYELR